MKNLCRKMLIVLIISIVFSCSKSDKTETILAKNPPFFNLNVGSTWVYKNYQSNSNNLTQFQFTGVVDTVKIVGIENIQGFSFAKRSIKKIYLTNGSTISTKFTYLRINNQGHLIEIENFNEFPNLLETDGLVIHPINDYQYIFDKEINIGTEVVGNIKYKLYNADNILVEGQNYSVLPFKGVFTPSLNQPNLISKTTEYNYCQNIGLIKSIDHSVQGNTICETRLV